MVARQRHHHTDGLAASDSTVTAVRQMIIDCDGQMVAWTGVAVTRVLT